MRRSRSSSLHSLPECEPSVAKNIQARWSSEWEIKDRVIEIRKHYQAVAGTRRSRPRFKSSCTDVENFEPSRSTGAASSTERSVRSSTPSKRWVITSLSTSFNGELWFSYVEIRSEALEVYGISRL